MTKPASPTPPAAPRRLIPCPPWAEAFRSLAIAARCANPMQMIDLLEAAPPSLRDARPRRPALRAATRTLILSAGIGAAEATLSAIAPLVDGVLDEVLDASAPTVELAAARLADVEARIQAFVDAPPREVDVWLRKGARENRDGGVSWNPAAREAFTAWSRALRALACSLTAIVRTPGIAAVEWLGCAGPGATNNASLLRALADRIREQIPNPPEGFAEPTPPEGWTEKTGGAA
ncbi:MAG: hypothetical protein U1E39_13185 [Planctomycetota bacterium]